MFGDIFGAGGGGFHVEDVSAPRRTDIPVTVTLEEAYAGASRTVTMPANPLSGNGVRRLEVSIPTGVRSGSRVHIGAAGQDRGLDIYLVVTVAPHRMFERSSDDLATTIAAPLLDMVLGGEVEVPTIAGKKVALKLPPETENGKVFRLKGRGMPRRREGTAGSHGDELVTVQAVLPKNMGPDEWKLFEQLQELGVSGV
jgi:DnaJ-class molecular chaperone